MSCIVHLAGHVLHFRDDAGTAVDAVMATACHDCGRPVAPADPFVMCTRCRARLCLACALVTGPDTAAHWLDRDVVCSRCVTAGEAVAPVLVTQIT